jgi:hypothetical protein
MNPRRLAPYVLAGALTFAAVQYALFASSRGWFLDSGTSVAIVIGVLAVASAVMAVAAPGLGLLQGSGAFAAGAVVAMAIALFVVGPGTIFPIVIAVGAACIGVAAVGGGLAGVALRSVFHARGPRIP